MTILVISAHDDPRSYVAALHNTALGVFERGAHKVLVSDLYAQGFNPIASKIDFQTKSNTHANYMFEQQRTVNTGSHFSPDITAEMEKVAQADLLVIHFPLWWGGPPAILKGWIERVLAMGFAWSPEGRYANGLLKGKKVLITTTAGDPKSFYSPEGMHRATVEQHLYSLLHNTFALCGLAVLKPFIVHNTTAASTEELDEHIKQYQHFLQAIESYSTYLYR
jgi:NAD(P)H dehydrogenase (quinone)